MKAFSQILFIACALLKTTQGSPKHLWPLNAPKLLWDYDKGNGANDGFVDGGNCPLLSTDAAFGSNSFYFDGSGRSVADLLVVDGNDYDSFSFTMYLKPDPTAMASTLVIFEYHANNDGNLITKVVVEMNNGRVQFTVARQSGTTWGNLLSDVVLDTASFNRVLLSVDKNDGKMYLQLGNVIKTFSLGGNLKQFRAPGTFRIGDAFASTGAGYRGHLTCMAFFDVRVTVADHSSEFSCGGYTGGGSCPVSDPSAFAATTTTTTEATTTTTEVTTTTAEAITTAQPPSLAPQPTHLWPLDNVTRGYDVITGSPPLTSQQVLACLRTESQDSALSLTNDAVLFDGSLVSSAVEVEVNSSVWDDDFTVVLFAKPQQPPEGLILSYSSTPSVGMSRIELGLQSDWSLLLRAWGSTSSAPCGEITTGSVLNGVGSVAMVILGRDAAGLSLNVSGVVWTALDSCPRSTGSSGQGSLKVGGRGEGESAGYRGHVVCMAVFSQYVSTVDDVQLISQCGSYDPAPYLGTSLCDNTPHIQAGKYSLLAQLKEPDMTTFSTMTSLRTSSAVKCAGRCLRTEHCRSFSFSSTNVTSLCRLFDIVTVTGLINSDSSYYVITSIWISTGTVGLV